MHEFELGVFKALFIHLIRICYAIGAHVVQILNERSGICRHKYSVMTKHCLSRFRRIPKFGHYTIRKFMKDASALKQMAAHDFEDLLQVRCLVNVMFMISPLPVRPSLL